MKKTTLLLLLVFASLSLAFSQTAQKVDETKAYKTAQAFIASQQTLKEQDLSLVSSDGIYIYNIGSQGFVIISGNTVLSPVLAWSIKVFSRIWKMHPRIFPHGFGITAR